MAVEIGAVILAAGKGSRLNCQEIPKAMIPIGGRPIIARSLEILNNCHFTKNEIAVVVGYLGNKVTEYCGGDVNIAQQTKLNGNAPAVESGLLVLPPTSHALIMQADDCLTINPHDLQRLITLHIRKQSDITALLSSKPEPDTHKKGFVTDTKNNIINEVAIDERLFNVGYIAGTYCFKTDFLKRYLPEIREINSERRLTDLLSTAFERHKFSGLILEHDWIGVNNSQQLWKARNWVRDF